MNTFLSRANTIFAFTLSVLAGLTLLCFVSTVFDSHQADFHIETKNIQVKNVPDYSSSREKNDLGFVNFDLSADLNSLFNWNIKQLFVYLTAEYETANNKLNQVVLWDKIIRRGEDAALDYTNQKSKYYFFDDGHGLKANKNVTLTLSWNVIPNAGTLPKIKATRSHRLEFPEEYSPNTNSRF